MPSPYNRESWIKKLEVALHDFVETAEEMIDDHRDALGGGEVECLEASLGEAEKKCALLVIKLARPNPMCNQLPSTASLPPVKNNYEAQAERTAQVNIDIDADITGKESEDEATDEEEVEITHQTSTAESSNDNDSHDDNEDI